MSVVRIAIFLPGVALLSGCGAILHGPRQNVDVQTSPGGAKVVTSPATGEFTTPATLSLERKNNYTLTFTSPGYNPATFYIHNGIGPGTVVMDVLLTGLVGVAVDGLTGSWYGLEPESADVTLTKSGTGGSGPDEIHIEVRQSDHGRRLSLSSEARVPSVSVRVERQ